MFKVFPQPKLEILEIPWSIPTSSIGSFIIFTYELEM